MTTIAEAVAAADFGTASARKSGRNPAWPYVPVVLLRVGNRVSQRQILGRAFATRPEAVAYAERSIAAARDRLARDLAKPNYRALREQYGIGEVPS